MAAGADPKLLMIGAAPLGLPSFLLVKSDWENAKEDQEMGMKVLQVDMDNNDIKEASTLVLPEIRSEPLALGHDSDTGISPISAEGGLAIASRPATIKPHGHLRSSGDAAETEPGDSSDPSEAPAAADAASAVAESPAPAQNSGPAENSAPAEGSAPAESHSSNADASLAPAAIPTLDEEINDVAE